MWHRICWQVFHHRLLSLFILAFDKGHGWKHEWCELRVWSTNTSAESNGRANWIPFQLQSMESLQYQLSAPEKLGRNCKHSFSWIWKLFEPFYYMRTSLYSVKNTM
jgi:hypothetical protein